MPVVIESSQQQSTHLQGHIEQFIAQQEDLQRIFDLLCSIKGIGAKTATCLLAERGIFPSSPTLMRWWLIWDSPQILAIRGKGRGALPSVQDGDPNLR